MALSTIGFLAIDAGGTFLKSAVLNGDGEVFEGSSYSCPSFSDGSKDQILAAFNKIVNEGLLIIKERGLDLKGIGFAFPGPFDIEKATPLMMHKFQGIYGLNLRHYVYANSRVPQDIPIRFIQDANAVLLGEIWKGNAQGFLNAAVVTLGTGLGFAISEDGSILCNEIGGPLLKIYNLPYKEGILEDYTAKRGFIQTYQKLCGKTNIDGIEVADIGHCANNGDDICIQTFAEVGQILAQSLKEILLERRIECLLFGGQISRSFSHMEQSLNDGLKHVKCLKKISVVKSIDHAALFGAVHYPRQNNN